MGNVVGKNVWTNIEPGFYVIEWFDDGTFIPRRMVGPEIEEAKTGSFVYLGAGQTYTMMGTCPEDWCVFSNDDAVAS